MGYVNFDNDSSIVEGVAEILPIFFFLVAALVCSTTMTKWWMSNNPNRYTEGSWIQ